MKIAAIAIAILAAILLTAPVTHAGDTSPPDPVIDLAFDTTSRTVTWDIALDTDPGDDADGFRITYTTVGRRTNVVTYDAAADARSFTLPDDAPRFLCRSSVSIEVVAFNEAGASPPAKVDIQSVCPPFDGPPFLHFTLPDLAVPSADASVYTISWEPVDGAHAYLLGGTLTAVRESATDCTDPSPENTRAIVLDVEVAASATTHAITLPPLPPNERWRVMPLTMVTFSVLDQYGEPFGGVGQTLVRESCGFGRAQVQLPSAGAPTSPSTLLLSAALAVATLGVGLIGFGAAHRYTSIALRSAAAAAPSAAAASRSISLRS